MYREISATQDQRSPDGVEGQLVFEEGLEGDSSQSQGELETLLRGWRPRASTAVHKEHTIKDLTSDCIQARST